MVQLDEEPNQRSLYLDAVLYTKSRINLGIKASNAATRCHLGILETMRKNPSECVWRPSLSMRITVSKLFVLLL